MPEWIEYTHRINFWHHITPKTGLADGQCLVDHFHLQSKWIVSVEVDEQQFLDVKVVKKIVSRWLNKLHAPLPIPLEELKKIADSSGNVGQAGGLRKSDQIESVNEVLDVEDASAEYLLRWLSCQVSLGLLQEGYGWRKVKVWFRETENYSFSVD